MAAQSGGTLTLSSAPASGTTAELWLPIAEEAALASEQIPIESVLAARPATVLLVDDEELVRVGTAEMLIDLGYSVIQAGSGAEALSILRGGEFEVDALVTDYLMPGMSGADVVREARSTRPDLPALLVTGYTNLAQGPGAELVRLTKPFRQAELATRMADILEAARVRENAVRLPDAERSHRASAE